MTRQYEEVHKMDMYDERTGQGVVARMADILGKRGFLPGTQYLSMALPTPSLFQVEYPCLCWSHQD